MTTKWPGTFPGPDFVRIHVEVSGVGRLFGCHLVLRTYMSEAVLKALALSAEKNA